MQVREVSFYGFMSYADVQELTLPPVGLVLVTGVNGAGKSALLEAVSYAGWGKTLRGTDPRQQGVAGAAVLTTSFGMEVTRSWKASGAKRVDVASTGLAEFSFENATKAAEHAAEVLGPWETWRRSCVFSTVDDMSFASAADADRKRLLESILGLQRFDVALARCRDDARKADVVAQQAATAAVRATAALEGARSNLATLRALAASWVPPVGAAGLRDQVAVMAADLALKSAATAKEWLGLEEARRARATWTARDQQLTVIGRALATDPVCPTCGQAFPDATHRQAKLDAHRSTQADHRLATPPEPDDGTWVLAHRSELAVREALSATRSAVAATERDEVRYREAAQAVATAETQVADAAAASAAATSDVIAAKRRQLHLSACDVALGTRGARAHMLAGALAGLEASANLWLERVARVDAPLTLRLSPYTDKKSGGTSDAISLEVEGAGGGRGYRASSGGERRRIDVALMLALAEVAQAADNRVAPTMWFDEVFDALDAPGVAAVCAAVEQLAQDRCVVVITHNSDMISTLEADVRLRVWRRGDRSMVEVR
jgi:DNA repair exonuclease SbcCD ATPase subunit